MSQNQRLLQSACISIAALIGQVILNPATAQVDALSLESAPVEKPQTAGDLKFILEGAIGDTARRFGLSGVGTNRASFDVSYTGKLDNGLRFVFSDRIDAIHPLAAPGADSVVNSLREAYVSWPLGNGQTVLEVGRINLRNGPGYGYNPTDFFRDGSLRVLTSADPFALRQNRIGSVMVRGQQIWSNGSFSVAYSPKLATRPSADGWSLDLGSTNNSDRLLLTLGTKLSEQVNSQLFFYKEDGESATVGANLTALLSDAATAHVEWTHGREPDLLTRSFLLPANLATRNRVVGGVTYTTLGKTSLTLEYEYNGFGLNRSGWNALVATPGRQLAYVMQSIRLQELATRQAVLFYVTQKGLVLRDLDLSAYIRFNPSDKSKLAWIELRHHWSSFDLTFQVQWNIGRLNTEFGVLPERRVFQLLGSYYF